jgi:putative endonuclease
MTDEPVERGGGGAVLAKDAVGAYGERVAAAHLASAGMVVLDRNWRCSSGEIDIVARDGDVLVFCEVKTRTSVAFGTPLEAVTPRKAARLRRLAAAWMRERSVHVPEVRIDIVGVLRPTRGPARVEHVRGVA